MKKIFKQSIGLFCEDKVRMEAKEVRVDTTVKKKNINFPYDQKLHTKKLSTVNGSRKKKIYN